MQHSARAFDAVDTAGHAERDVQQVGDALDPAHVDATGFRTGTDVVEHQFVRALVAIAQCQIDDVAHVDVVAEAHALHHPAVAHVQAGNDAPAQHGAACGNVVFDSTSDNANRPSSKARPSTMPAQPALRAASTSAAAHTPPDACSAQPGCAVAMRR